MTPTRSTRFVAFGLAAALAALPGSHPARARQASAAPPAGSSETSSPPAAGAVQPGDPRFHFVGHWDRRTSTDAITVNSGSRVTCAFTGTSVTGLFGTSGITSPAQIWVRIDDGPPARFSVSAASIDFAPQGLKPGRHTFELDVKDVDERVNRWEPPLQAALDFKGLALGAGGDLKKSSPPGKVRMEFYGDSITQGVRIDNMAIGPDGSDGTKDYAYLVALAFGALHNQVGFGRQGIIRTGNGNVPVAAESFGWNYGGSPDDPAFVPQVVVVNQGTNDGSIPSAQFEPAYRAYIAEIHARDRKATIFCLRPFGGYHADDIRQAVEELHDPGIVYVDTSGWLVAGDYIDGVHPTAAGQLKAAERLAEVIHQRTGLKMLHPLPAAGAAGP